MFCNVAKSRTGAVYTHTRTRKHVSPPICCTQSKTSGRTSNSALPPTPTTQVKKKEENGHRQSLHWAINKLIETLNWTGQTNPRRADLAGRDRAHVAPHRADLAHCEAVCQQHRLLCNISKGSQQSMPSHIPLLYYISFYDSSPGHCTNTDLNTHSAFVRSRYVCVCERHFPLLLACAHTRRNTLKYTKSNMHTRALTRTQGRAFMSRRLFVKQRPSITRRDARSQFRQG